MAGVERHAPFLRARRSNPPSHARAHADRHADNARRALERMRGAHARFERAGVARRAFEREQAVVEHCACVRASSRNRSISDGRRWSSASCEAPVQGVEERVGVEQADGHAACHGATARVCDGRRLRERRGHRLESSARAKRCTPSTCIDGKHDRARSFSLRAIDDQQARADRVHRACARLVPASCRRVSMPEQPRERQRTRATRRARSRHRAPRDAADAAAYESAASARPAGRSRVGSASHSSPMRNTRNDVGLASSRAARSRTGCVVGRCCVSRSA